MTNAIVVAAGARSRARQASIERQAIGEQLQQKQEAMRAAVGTRASDSDQTEPTHRGGEA